MSWSRVREFFDYVGGREKRGKQYRLRSRFRPQTFRSTIATKKVHAGPIRSAFGSIHRFISQSIHRLVPVAVRRPRHAPYRFFGHFSSRTFSIRTRVNSVPDTFPNAPLHSQRHRVQQYHVAVIVTHDVCTSSACESSRLF